MSGDLSHFSMRELFRIEAEGQVQALSGALIELEQDFGRQDLLEVCMRAAHSLKGAARIVDIGAAVTVAHAMEDIFVLAQQGDIRLDQSGVDRLLRGVDLIASFAQSPDLETGAQDEQWQAEAEAFVAALSGTETAAPPPAAAAPAPCEPPPDKSPEAEAPVQAPARPPTPSEPRGDQQPETLDRALRVSSESLDRLLDLAGETLVESRWVRPFGQSLLRLKQLQRQAALALESLDAALPAQGLDERARAALADAQRGLRECQKYLADRLDSLEASDQRASVLAHRLYDQALMVRMRPFADGTGAFPRLVRDLGRELGKDVRFEIRGERTQVDRDILERLEAPIGHMLRNAIDHGIESPEERIAAGKPAQAVIAIEADHHAGALQITVSDDGRGIDPERIREAVVTRRLASAETAARLSESELLEFLFLPGFTMKETVTEISGRGVGLDVVQDMIRQVRGLVRISSTPGEGTRFKLELPLTLSVLRSLLVEIGGEPYAFPIAHLVRALKIGTDRVQSLEGRPHFDLDGQQIGLVGAHQVLGCGDAASGQSELHVVLLGSAPNLYGLVVERFLGARELVVQPLDRRLGKIKDIAAAALTEDGTPVLIVDVEDMIRSIEKLSSTDRLARSGQEAGAVQRQSRKRVLIVDDSLTVRELQRKLLDHHGYDVEVAVDGMDGWNALNTGSFDLVVSDVDMPRMDGIELVRRIRQDAALRSLPVMIVSYKDREDDRRRGLDAGADYYLTKGSFQSEALIEAVVDLIGEAVA